MRDDKSELRSARSSVGSLLVGALLLGVSRLGLARGNDGLTRAERSAYAERWRNGAGKAPPRGDTKKMFR